HELDRQPLRTDRDPQLAEVVVGDPAFPEPAAGNHRPQRVRRRMPPRQRGPLLLRRAPNLPAYLGQITHVVAPLGVELGLLVGAATVLPRHEGGSVPAWPPIGTLRTVG